MLNIFKKSPIKKLDKEYKKLMKEGFELSRINRSESDKKYADADRILQKIKELEESEKNQ